jgi:hypothetical protein
MMPDLLAVPLIVMGTATVMLFGLNAGFRLSRWLERKMNSSANEQREE